MRKSIFLFFAAILCAMSANAYNQSAKDLYFDNSEAKWSSCYVYIGHSTWTSCYDMTRVSGTQYLWKLPANFNGGSAWNGASGWVVCKEKWWASNGESIDKYVWHGDKNVTKKSTSAWEDTKIYKTNGSGNVTSDGTTKNVYNVTSYTKNNYTVTINTVEGGTLTVKDYDNNAVATGASKIHLTVLKFSATPADGYVLDGVEINNGSTTTTIAATDLASKTYTLTSNVTITPVWHATTSTVTITTSATNGTAAGGGVVKKGASVTLTATPADGYKFVNWTVGGAEVSTANPYTFTAEEDVTVVANFEELPKETVYFVNNKNWSKINAYAWNSTGNNGWPGQAMTATGEQVAGFDVYSYTAIEGNANVIFNDGSAQTADYVWTNGNYYYMGAAANYAGGTKEEVAKAANPDPLATEVYLAGAMNSWNSSSTAFRKATAEGTTASVSVELTAGTHEFKIVDNGAWYGNDGTMDREYHDGWTFSVKKANSDEDQVNAKIKADIAGEYTFTWDMNSKKLTVTYPALPTFTINVTTDDDRGTIEGAGTYTQGAEVTLIAEANPNYKFLLWRKTGEEVEYSKENPLRFTATENVDLRAEFVLVQRIVKVTAENGTVTAASGLVISKEASYPHGTEAKLTATPADHYVFVSWTKGEEVVSTEATYSFTVTEDVALKANFKPDTHKVTLIAQTEGSVEGDNTYTHGDSATIRATAFPGYKFVNWVNPNGSEVVSTEPTYSFPVVADITLIAYFELDTYEVTLIVNEGEGSVEGAGTYANGASATVVATPVEGYEFVKWLNPNGNIVVSTDANYTFTVTEAITLLAYFQPLSHTITATAGQGGTVTGGGEYTYGTEVTLTATADFDYEFVNWTAGEEVLSTIATYTFIPEADVNVVANFQEVATTEVAESGVFTIGKNKTAIFATGNLQYNVGTDTWRFAKQQYQVVGEQNIELGDTTFTGWIDMLGWSNGEANNWGVNPNNVNELYAGEFVDWGTKMGAEWSTLSADDWKYLLNTRANASALKQVARVGEMVGILLFPDAWTMPEGIEVEAAYDEYFEINVYNYTLAQWAKMEEAGAIFLPAAGRRTGGWGNTAVSEQFVGKPEGVLDSEGHYKHFDNFNDYCYYWTSTINEETKNVSYLHNIVALGNDEYTIGTGAIWGEKGRYGQSVRLAKVTEVPSTYTVTVTAATETLTQAITIDGNNADWATVPMLTEPGAEGPVVKMAVAQDGLALPEGAAFALMVEGDHEQILANYPVIYVDADKSTATGSIYSMTKNMGVDYEMSKSNGTYKANEAGSLREMTINKDAFSKEGLPFNGSVLTWLTFNWGALYLPATPSNNNWNWSSSQYHAWDVKPYTYANIGGTHTAAGVYNTHEALVPGETLKLSTSGHDIAFWAAWTVELTQPAIYDVKANLTATNSTSLDLYLIDVATNKVVASREGDKKSAPQEEFEYGTWDLTAVPAGKYMLKVKNHVQYSDMTFTSVTLTPQEGVVFANTVTGSGTYEHGATAELTATPATGYEFVKWSNDETANPYSFEVTEDVTLTATFQKKSYTVTILKEAKNQNITIDGDNADWATVPMLTEPGAEGPVVKMAVAQDGLALPEGAAFALMVEGDHEQILANYPVIYVDADKSTATGSIYSMTKNMGVDYEMSKSNGTYKANEAGSLREMTINKDAFSKEGLPFNGSVLTWLTFNWGALYLPATPSNNNWNWSSSQYHAWDVKPYTYANIGGTHTAAGVYNTHEALVPGETLKLSTSGHDIAFWAAWTVELTQPAIYDVKANLTATNSTSLDLYLIDVATNKVVASREGDKKSAPQEEFEYGTWDLTAVPAGKYMLKVKNHVQYSDMTFTSVTLTPQESDVEVESAEHIITGDGTYLYGEVATLKAIAATGYEFVNWSNGETANPYSFVVTKDVEIAANFIKSSATIAVVAENGTVAGLENEGVYDIGTELTLTATPNFDYEFVNWTVGGTEVSTSATYTFTVETDIELVANFQEIPATTMKSGKFSVGANKTAVFTPGNLQYHTGSKEWRFAKQQYQVVGEQNIEVGNPDFKGWIDMLGWSNGEENNYGVNPSNANKDYEGEFVDWGTLFADEDSLSTLTADEWNYLLYQRDADLKQLAQVGDVVGIMLFPDNWLTPEDANGYADLDEDGVLIQFYTLAEWEVLENAGAIFLPAAGRRTGGWGNMINYDQVEETKPEMLVNGGFYRWQDNTNVYSYYWSSTKDANNLVSYVITCEPIGNDEYILGAPVLWKEKGRYGQSVRLAKVTTTSGGNTGTNLDNILVGEKAAKVIINGQLVIIKNGKAYNAMGQEI